MSGEMERRRDNSPARPGGRGGKPSPLKSLPEDFRKPAGFFFAFHSDILKGTVGLAARLRMWAQEDGLTAAEAREAMKRLMNPARCAAFQYAGQLLAALAEEVGVIVKKRRDREAVADFRRRQEAAAKDAAPAAVRDLLQTFGKLDPEEDDRG